MSEEQKQKLRKPKSEEHKEKLRGSNNPNYGKVTSDEVKQKISSANKKPKSEETKAAMKAAWILRKKKKRKPVSEETKRKMSESQQKADHPCRKPGPNNPNTGKKRSQKTKDAIGRAHKGKVLSDETREKIAAKLKGVPLSEERKQAMRKAPRPKQSPEQIAKRVAATKATKLNKLEKK